MKEKPPYMHYFEPTEFEQHVKLFDTTFSCHPLTRTQMRDKLAAMGGDPVEPLLDYVLDLQKRAFFGLRLALLIEETGEYCEAFLKEKSKEEQENEVADIEYVLHGLNDVMGHDANAARGRVAQKNHTKIQNKSSMKIGSNGKIIKPEDQ